MEEQKISECQEKLEDSQHIAKAAQKVITELVQENKDLAEENKNLKDSIKILLACSLTSADQEKLCKRLFREYPGEELPRFFYKMIVEIGIQPSDILWTMKEQSA